MDLDISRLLTRLRADNIKKKDLEILFNSGCSAPTIAKLYNVPLWVIANKCSEFGLHKNYYAKVQLENRTSFSMKNYKQIITDIFVRVVLEVGYSHEYPTQMEVARSLNITYANLIERTLPLLQNFGFIEFVKRNKREKRIKLTDKGIKLFNHFVEIVGMLEN